MQHGAMNAVETAACNMARMRRLKAVFPLRYELASKEWRRLHTRAISSIKHTHTLCI